MSALLFNYKVLTILPSGGLMMPCACMNRYPYEEIMYRWDHLAKQVFVRFYVACESNQPVPFDNRLFNEALRFGDEITQEEFFAGRSRL